MNSKSSITMLSSLGIAAALAFSACSKSDYGDTTSDKAAAPASTAEKAMDDVNETTARMADSASSAAASTWNSIKDATYEGREKFRDGVEKMTASIDTTIDNWANKASTLPAASRDAWNSGMAELKDAREALSDELDDLQSASADTWDEAKDEVNKAWNRVQQAYRNLENQLTQ